MNERVGQLSFEMPKPGEMVFDKPYSETTAMMIDEEVRKIVQVAYDKTMDLLTKHKDDVEKVGKLRGWKTQRGVRKLGKGSENSGRGQKGVGKLG